MRAVRQLPQRLHDQLHVPGQRLLRLATRRGHAEYVLAARSALVPLPDALSFVDGALIACGFGTAYEGLRRIAVNGDGDLLVVGLGPVGLAAGMIGKGMGAARVIGVEPNERRREWAADLDVFDTLASPEEAAEEVGRATTGRGAATVIDCSGSRAGRSLALENAAEWGRVSLVGEGGTLETEVSDTLLHKQLTLYARSEEHTSELQSRGHLVCRLLLE